MAQQVQINGITYTYLNAPDWSDSADSQALDGVTPFLRWHKHTIKTNIMPMTEFDRLYALEGQAVALTTTNYLDRNGDYITYYGAILESVTGKHESINAADVVATFRVRL